MNNKFYLFALTANLLFAQGIKAMSNNNNAVDSYIQTNKFLKKFQQAYHPLGADQLKKEFAQAGYPERFSFYEKFIKARLAKIAHLAQHNPRNFVDINLVLQELLQTPAANHSKLNQSELTGKNHPCRLTNELITFNKPVSIPHTHEIQSSVMAKNKNILFCGLEWDAITIHDMSDPKNPKYLGSIKQSIGGQERSIRSLALSADDKILFSGSGDENIKIWDVSDPAKPVLLATIDDQIDGDDEINIIYCLALSTDNKTLFSGTWDVTIKLYDVSNPRNPQLIKILDFEDDNSHTSDIFSLVLSSDNNTLFSCSDDQVDKNMGYF